MRISKEELTAIYAMMNEVDHPADAAPAELRVAMDGAAAFVSNHTG